jgi:hypothetical protein
MACRNLAQQRVLRIMQQQSVEQPTREATDRSAEREVDRARTFRALQPSEKRVF